MSVVLQYRNLARSFRDSYTRQSTARRYRKRRDLHEQKVSPYFSFYCLWQRRSRSAPAPRRRTPTLKIGFVSVTSGPAAAWGISNVRSMQARAEWLNEMGGVEIGGTTYDVEIVTFDDQKDPKRAIAGMEKIAQEGIHYVVGPNVDDGAAAVRPGAEQNGIIYFPYAFPKELYSPPASNAVLGMVASYQSGPAIYKHLKEAKGVKTIAFPRPQSSAAWSTFQVPPTLTEQAVSEASSPTAAR